MSDKFITKLEVRSVIAELEKHPVINLSAVSIYVNAYRATEQIRIKAQLNILYELLGEVRPSYPCDEEKPQPKTPIIPPADFEQHYE